MARHESSNRVWIRAGDHVDKEHLVRGADSDRELIGKVADGALAALLEDQLRQILELDSTVVSLDEVRDLLTFGRGSGLESREESLAR
jgi:hypothetical protein